MELKYYAHGGDWIPESYSAVIRGYLGTIDDEINKLLVWGNAITNWGVPYRCIGFGGIGYDNEGSLSRFEVLSATSFCSVHPSTNFIGYSDVGLKYSAGFSSTESIVCKLSLNIQPYLLM